MGKGFQANGPRKHASVSVLIPDKIDFKPHLVRKDIEGHIILTKGTI